MTELESSLEKFKCGDLVIYDNNADFMGVVRGTSNTLGTPRVFVAFYSLQLKKFDQVTTYHPDKLTVIGPLPCSNYELSTFFGGHV